MLELSTLIWLCALAALAAFWWHSDQVKHDALQRVHQHCHHLGLQLLDQTLVIKGLAPARDESGSLCLRRTYRFEFSSTGEERYQGTVTLTGRRLQQITLDPHIMPEDTTTRRLH